jgi:hypothetical protein
MRFGFSTDLTGDTRPVDNLSAASEGSAVPEISVRSNLPEGWLPQGAAVRALARRYPDGHWEAVALDFSIAGVGDSPEAALGNVLELLDEYLCMSASQGLTFEEARRPLRPATLLFMFRQFAGLMFRSLLDRPDHDRNREDYRVPLHPVGAH